MSKMLVIVLAMMAGGLVAVQGVVNSQLGKMLSSPLQAALLSFAVGSFGLVVVTLLLGSGFPTVGQLSALPSRLWFGGLLGATFITATILLIPKVGVANMLVAAVAGQIVVSLVLDHYGVLGALQQSITPIRTVGTVLVITGLVAINQ